MKEIVSTVSSKGQVTIPVEVRKRLGLGRGDKLSFVIADSGRVELKVPRYPNVTSLRESLQGPEKEYSYDDMKEIAYEDRLVGKYVDGA
jgi:AbrB family looped-hinge helix DNA binding protein